MMEDKISEVEKDLLNLAPVISKKITDGFNRNKLRCFNNKATTSQGIQDITTFLDHKIGKLIIDEVYNKNKLHLTIDSEEESERIGKGKIILRFDPIDGSKHFVNGLPIIAFSASLIYKDEIRFGMIIEPFTGNVYHAINNSGAYINSDNITVNNKGISDDLSFVMYEAPNSKVYSKDSEKFDLFNMQLTSIQKTAYRMRNVGLSTLSICYVADGTSPLYIDFSGTTKLYDVEAAVLIAKEAGAVIGTTNGEVITTLEYSKDSDKKELKGNLLIGNPKAWEEVVKILNNKIF